MNKAFRAARLLAGVTPSSPLRPGRMQHAAAGDGDTSLCIKEAPRFHRARYEHLSHSLHGRCQLVAALLSCLILITLGWKAASGEFISPVRWLCGAFSGWFITSMGRLALFTCLAAPRFICLAPGKLRLSGLGTLRTSQILHWSIQHEALPHSSEHSAARIQLCCRWFGWRLHWTMLMEQGPETERLQRRLEAEMPRCSKPATPPLRRAIPIEAGILSQ